MFWPSPEDTSCCLEDYFGSCKVFSTLESIKMESFLGDDEVEEFHLTIPADCLSSCLMSQGWTLSESLTPTAELQQDQNLVTRRLFRLEEGPI